MMAAILPVNDTHVAAVIAGSFGFDGMTMCGGIHPIPGYGPGAGPG
jgi:hypothetical protein